MSCGHSDFQGKKTTRSTDVCTLTTYEVNGLSFALRVYTDENYIPLYRCTVPENCGIIYYVLEEGYSITAQKTTYSCKAGDMLFIQDSMEPVELALPGAKVFAFPLRSAVCSYYNIELTALGSHRIENNSPVYSLVKQLYRHFQMNTAYSHIDMDGIYRQTIGALLTRMYQPKALKHNLAAMAAELLNSGVNESKLRDKLAEKTGMHPCSVSRAFTKAHGISLKKFSFQKKVQRGAELLKTTQHPVSVISHTLGFSTPSHFTNAIKNHTGHAPSDWRGKY